MITNIFKMAVLLGAMTLSGGCTLFSAIAYQANGPAEIKAEYRPNEKEPMLVLVENFGGVGQLNQDAAYLSAALASEMKDHKVAPLIEPEAIERLRESKGENFRVMNVSDIARALGAKQVLYVNVLRADLDIPSGNSTVSGAMEVRVRIIDARTASTRWPESEDGQDVKITTPMVKRDSAGSDLQVHREMADKMGVTICNLFHDWKPQYEGQDKTQATGLGDGPG